MNQEQTLIAKRLFKIVVYQPVSEEVLPGVKGPKQVNGFLMLEKNAGFPWIGPVIRNGKALL